MIKFQLPTSDFIPHPDGTHEGRVVGIEDKGERETSFGLKHKVAIVIESETGSMDDGRPFTASLWVTLSGSTKSKLYKVRTALLGRDLTPEEQTSFEDTELIGKRVGYQVVHRDGREGGVFANIDQIWPLKQGAPQQNQTAETDEPPLPF